MRTPPVVAGLVALATFAATALPPSWARAFSIEPAPAATLGLAARTPEGATAWSVLKSAEITWVERDGFEVPEATFPPELAALGDTEIRLHGYMFPIEADIATDQFLLLEMPVDCPFCAAALLDVDQMVEVRAIRPVPFAQDPVTIAGRLTILHDDPTGLIYRLDKAQLVD